MCETMWRTGWKYLLSGPLQSLPTSGLWDGKNELDGSANSLQG